MRRFSLRRGNPMGGAVVHIQPTRPLPASAEARLPFLARASGLIDLIHETATATESLGTLAPEVVNALRETELFWMLVPREAGGGGAGLIDMLEVIELLTRADGSTGWTFMANVTATGIA